MKALLLLALSFLAATASAQWQSTTYTLKGGWNAIYLHGDATHATPDDLFPNSGATANVEEVWRWNPNPNQQQFSAASLVPNTGTPEWSVWRRGNPAQSTLVEMFGQSGYLVKCTGTSANSYSVPIVQRPRPPSSTWVRSGANLMGFPSFFNGSNYPVFSSYFATFPAAIATNSKIYKYVGGDLGPGNPLQVFSTNTERLNRNQAYWFEADVVSNYYAPVELSLSNDEGISFGRSGSVITMRVRNRTAANMTLNLAPVASIAAPVGQEGITGSVPLTRRTFNGLTGQWDETPISGAYTEVIAAQNTVTLSFGVSRPAMTGGSNALFASVLRLTDSGNLFQIDLPVTARKSSLAGLWIGEAQIDSVSSQVVSTAAARAAVSDGTVTGVEMTSRGVGYTSAPAVTFSPPFSFVQAQAAANVSSSGTVSSLTITTPGTAYTTPPTVTVTPPPAGVQAAASATLTHGQVSAIDLATGGTGYFAGATVTVAAAPAGTQATATATLSADTVGSINLTGGGTLYDTIPTVTVAPPGESAAATASLTNDTVSSLQVIAPGSSYAAPPAVIIAPPSSPAAAAATLLDGGVGSIAVTAAGHGYPAAPVVTIDAPGIQATATAILTGGGVGSISVSTAGSGYVTAPAVTISPSASGIAATAVATISGGAVTGVVITRPGTNYNTAPVVTIAAPGSAATAEVTMTGDVVTEITVTDPGSGYVTPPVVTLSAPPAGVQATATATESGGAITGFNITQTGSGYLTTPVVTIGTPGTQATAQAVISGGVITGITVTQAGSGYSSAPLVSVSAPTRNATALPFITGGVITEIQITDPGLGYSTTPDITISAPQPGSQATATAQVSGGAVTGLTVADPGSGYSTAPAVTIGGASPTAVATATLDDDAVASIAVTAPGSGYFTVPTVTVADPPSGGVRAEASATISGGFVTGINVTRGGSGYTAAPAITIGDPPSGTQATGTATIAGGVITGVTVTNAGSGYVGPPAITFGAPPAVPSSPTARRLPLRMLLHIDDAGNARVLSQVFLGKLAAPPHLHGLATRESALKQDEKAGASRLVAAHLPLDRVLGSGSGMAALGQTLVRTVSIPFDDDTNPFVHQYHPDHDNKDARGQPLGAGVESFSILRTMTFQFTTTPPHGSSATGWGSSTIGGYYNEILQGLHKKPIQTGGTFELRRASEIGTITLN